jgi:thiamine kinase-like enzyme
LLNSSKLKNIEEYILRKKWLSDIKSIFFLAAGEYNENYRIKSGKDEYVFRINHGSQLGNKKQTEYEFAVLKSLENSGVTPRPFCYDNDGEGFGNGVMLMEFVKGRPLKYYRDIEKAAYIFSKVHSQPIEEHFVVQKDPLTDIAGESLELIERYESAEYKNVRSTLLKYHEEMIALSQINKGIFANEKMCIVNTEVNSHNFVIGRERSYLVDWEKAVISYRYQDLGHFIVPTTTLWKTSYRYTLSEKKDFVKMYKDLLQPDIGFDEMLEKTFLLEKVILLRALSWCYMAYFEYTRPERKLKNRKTFRKLKYYMKEAECFLKQKI